MPLHALTTIIFGLLAIAAGVWRHIETEGSPAAVGFGLVMGTVAVAGGLLLWRGRNLAGYVVALVALAVVSAWFLQRVLSGHAEGLSPRVSLILAACAVEAAVLAWAGLRARRASPG